MRRFVVWGVLTLLPLAAHAATPVEEAVPAVSVLAESALAPAMAEAAREYSRSNGVAVTLAFFETQTSQNILAEGAGTDVLITVKSPWISELRQQGVVDIHSETALAENRLAFVSPEETPLPAPFADEVRSGRLVAWMRYPVIVAANPETLAEGAATRAGLRALDKAADLEPYVLYLKRREDMVEMVRESKAYGFFLESDARAKGFFIAGIFPENSHDPIRYRAVALAGENMDQGRKLIAWLKSPAGQAVFAAHGFTPPQAP